MFWSVTLRLLDGFKVTCMIFGLTLVIAIPLGLIIAFGSMSKFSLGKVIPWNFPDNKNWLCKALILAVRGIQNIYPIRWLCKTFVWIIRGVPLMLQVIIIFYVPGFLLGTPVSSRFNAVIIAFSINYACYFSEIYRGGIENISRSQFEAGQVLGMTKSQIFFRVVLLQVIKRILAPMSNEIITLVKDTALARVIMVVEIIKVAYDFMSKSLIWPLFYAGVFYLAFVGILTLLFNYTEKKLDYFRA